MVIGRELTVDDRVTATVEIAVKTLLFLGIVVLVVERGREEEEEEEVVRESEDEGGTL